MTFLARPYRFVKASFFPALVIASNIWLPRDSQELTQNVPFSTRSQPHFISWNFNDMNAWDLPSMSLMSVLRYALEYVHHWQGVSDNRERLCELALGKPLTKLQHPYTSYGTWHWRSPWTKKTIRWLIKVQKQILPRRGQFGKFCMVTELQCSTYVSDPLNNHCESIYVTYVNAGKHQSRSLFLRCQMV